MQRLSQSVSMTVHSYSFLATGWPSRKLDSQTVSVSLLRLGDMSSDPPNDDAENQFVSVLVRRT